MKNIHFSVFEQRQEKRFGLQFDYDSACVGFVREIKGFRFSKTLRIWHAPCKKDVFHALTKAFDGTSDFNLVMEDDFSYDLLPFDTYVFRLTASQKQAIKVFKDYLISRRYSESTIETYTSVMQTFLGYYAERDIASLEVEDVIKFNTDYIIARKYSGSFQNQVVNSLKLFFNTVTKSSMEIDLVHRPRREHKLPNILNKEEVKRILTGPRNIKHRMVLSLIYSCGLRRSELLNLKITDVDSARKLLIVRQSKGKKDRVVPLSEKIIAGLREYYVAYKPQCWLFEGLKAGERYSEKSLEHILKDAVAKSGIKKSVSLHWFTL